MGGSRTQVLRLASGPPLVEDSFVPSPLLRKWPDVFVVNEYYAWAVRGSCYRDLWDNHIIEFSRIARIAFTRETYIFPSGYSELGDSREGGRPGQANRTATLTEPGVGKSIHDNACAPPKMVAWVEVVR